ncbi:MAG: hypothetical protein WCY09_09640 [Candidatus Omnitrophota bacterium]
MNASTLAYYMMQEVGSMGTRSLYKIGETELKDCGASVLHKHREEATDEVVAEAIERCKAAIKVLIGVP